MARTRRPHANALLNAALAYRERGWSVIPIKARNKKPAVDWKPFQTRRATAEEIKAWFRGDANIGVVTATISELIVLDVDGQEGVTSLEKLPPLPRTWRSSTGRGEHYWFKHPGKVVRNFVKKLPGLDLRGDGGYVVVPPSRHASGVLYEWITSPEDAPLAQAPKWLLELGTQPERKPKAGSSGLQAEVIPKGQRNEVLTSNGGAMRRHGLSASAIEEGLLAVNAAVTEEPLENPEVVQIATSVARYDPVNPMVTEPYTDLGNARRLVARHGAKLRFVPQWGKWLVWDGSRWAEDTRGLATECAKETARALLAVASTAPDHEAKALAKHALLSQSAPRIGSMLTLARTEPGIPVTPDELDADSWALNVASGTIDLRSGKLREHRREDRITKMAPVPWDGTAQCRTWIRFLDEIMDGDGELVAFLKRAIGYALTADNTEHCLFILYGTGANGKSTFLNTISTLLGDYARTTRSETLLVRRGDAIPNDIARLHGARFVTAAETEGGRRLAEGLVKSVTGGDLIAARFLHQEFFTGKLFIATNHRPRIAGTDNGIWRRIRLIPFEVSIPPEKLDKNLADKLRRELPGILRWAVEGCREWQDKGLGMPEPVRKATEGYRTEMDAVASFVSASCVREDGARVGASELYSAYAGWCAQTGEFKVTIADFKERLEALGLHQKNTKKGKRWVGLRLADSDSGWR